MGHAAALPEPAHPEPAHLEYAHPKPVTLSPRPRAGAARALEPAHPAPARPRAPTGVA